MNPLRPALSGLALGFALLVGGGCSGEEPAQEDAASAKPSADAVDTLLDTGRQQTEDGDLEAARGTFESVLTLDPTNALAYYNLGVVAHREDRLGLARDEYAAALEHDPDLAPALYNLGILTESVDLTEAVDLFERAVESDPDLAAAHMRLGFALVHLGNTEAGEQHLAEGLALDPTMADVEAPDYD